VLRWLVIGVGGLAIVLTLLPMIPSNKLWIRIWDFPRIQIAVVLAIVLLAAPLVFSLGRSSLSLMAVAAAALAWQLYGIWPYTPFHPIQAKAASVCDDKSRVRLLISNVLIDNRKSRTLLDLVEDMDPDIVLLVETDAWWDGQLAPLKDVYPHVVAYPLENSYGIHLFSRFPLTDPKVRFLVEPDVPSIKTGLTLPSGARINFYGIHPKPPPHQDTDERDAELLIIGKEVREEGAPSIVAGDMNDVAWSPTSTLLQEISGLLDPRIGRGPHATFHANWRLLRWPLDQVFFEKSFLLREIAVQRDIGSDHFPFYVELCHHPAAAIIQDEPQPEPSDLDAAEEAIEEGQEKARD
jgi:endonuclease/exonuclease/phosphatase (EEP) superfamily protein YafD